LIWLARIPALVVVILFANLAAAFKWQEFTSRSKMSLSDLLELGLHGAGTIIWLVAIPVSALAFVPAVIAIVAAERRRMWSWWQFALGGASINASAYYVLKMLVVWSWGPGPVPDPVSELLCMAGGGALGGAIYWALAGRKPRGLPTTA
jgi:hypothetical protein